MKRKVLWLALSVFLISLVLSSCFLLRESLTLDSNPQGVQILVDSQTIVTPDTLNLQYGSHVLQVLSTYLTTSNYGGSPNTEYVFSSWSDGSTSNPRTITLKADQSYTANMLIYYKFLTGSNISVTPISSPVSQNEFYLYNSQIQITAPKVQGYQFSYWIVNGQAVTGNPLTQIITLSTQATAVYEQIVPPSLPSNPYPADGSTGTSTNVALSWYTKSNGASVTYSLYFGTSQNPSLYFSDLTSPEYTISNLNYSTTYYWYIIASNGYFSTKGSLWSFTTQSEPIPSAPTGLYYTSVTSNSVSLSWSPSQYASGYNVYRSTNETNFSKISSTSNTYYTDTNLSPSMTYYYEITAYNSSGESGYSNPITVTISQGQYGIINGSVNVYTGQSAFISSVPVQQSTIPWQIQRSSGLGYVPGEVVVGFKRGISPSMLSSHPSPFGYHVVSNLQTPNYEVNASLIKVSTSVENAISYFKSLPNVAYAEPNYIVHALSAPNDPYYADQWYLPDIQSPQAWNVSTGANTVIVAVIDTGVSSTHPDLQNILVPGFNFVNNTTNTMDDYGHGTFVAGIIDADTNNGIGIAGINWGGANSTKIMPIVVLGPDGSGSTYYVSEGIVYAVEHGAKVINLSLGGTNYDPTEASACQYAYDNNVVVVAAAGNDSSNSLEYPAAFPHVIPVAALGPDNTLAYYSNYSATVICAYGGAMHYNGDPNGIFSTTYSTSTGINGYGYWQGTSFAAPQVSAVAALMIAHGITGVDNITKILENTATNIGPSSIYGYGLLNAYNAVTYNGGWEPMVVWAQNALGQIVAKTAVSANGTFSFNVPIGNYQIYAWQDFNGDGKVDQGDLYGYYGYNGTSSTPIIMNIASATYSINISVSPEVNTPPAINEVGNVSDLKTFIEKTIKAHYRK